MALLGSEPSVSEVGTYMQGYPAVAVGFTKREEIEGWLWRTEDGQEWFVPQDVAAALHLGSHDCDGLCPAGAAASIAAEERAR